MEVCLASTGFASRNVCRAIWLLSSIVIVSDIYGHQGCFAYNDRVNRLSRKFSPIISERGGLQRGHHYEVIQQNQMNSQEYEKLSVNEVKTINDSSLAEAATTTTTPSTLVIPSRETNGNSQVVFVNFTRVVSDGNKTESTRLIDNNEQFIKQDGQISCGETNRNGQPSMTDPLPEPLQNRIVGGTKAEPGEFPFQVRLNIRSRRGSSLCGGVIIDQRHILTAAHCMTTW